MDREAASGGPLRPLSLAATAAGTGAEIAIPPPGPIIAGIGASAGGIQALQAFFEALPENTGVAFVVVVHLSPEHRSMLPAIRSASGCGRAHPQDRNWMAL